MLIGAGMLFISNVHKGVSLLVASKGVVGGETTRCRAGSAPYRLGVLYTRHRHIVPPTEIVPARRVVHCTEDCTAAGWDGSGADAGDVWAAELGQLGPAGHTRAFKLSHTLLHAC